MSMRLMPSEAVLLMCCTEQTGVCPVVTSYAPGLGCASRVQWQTTACQSSGALYLVTIMLTRNHAQDLWLKALYP